MALEKLNEGHVVQLWTARNPQGFNYRQFGKSDYFLTDFDGLALVTRLVRSREKSKVAKESDEPLPD